MPPIFRWVMSAGNIAPEEMLRTFNCGIGMVIVVSPEQVDNAIQLLQDSGDAKVYKMGTVSNSPGVQYTGMDKWASQASL